MHGHGVEHVEVCERGRALRLRFSPSLLMKNISGDPIGPTVTTQGSFGERRTRRELAGRDECTVRSTTVRAEGVNAMS
jgi:hypothetical protein